MKKLLAVLGVMLFSASVFALNTEASSDDICNKEWNKIKNTLNSTHYAVTVHIIQAFADPFETLSDAQALPKAECYMSFRVKGKKFLDFVRTEAGVFEKNEKEGLLAFADRVERLYVQHWLDANKDDQNHVMEWVLVNLAIPMESQDDTTAMASAKVYQNCRVNGMPLMEYVRVHASEYYAGDIGYRLDTFVERVNKLTEEK